MKILKYKYYNKQITTHDNGNVQSHDKEESKLNDTINMNSGAHTLTHDKIIRSLTAFYNPPISFYALDYRCFQICSSWAKFHTKLTYT